jgi:lipid-A-disaccharide synthase
VASLADKTRSSDAILISTGEASGDAVGAALLSEMRKLGFSGKACAVGASKLARSGAELLADSTNWGAIGIYQAMKVAPRVWLDYRRVVAWLKRNRPALVIAIDFGFVNIKLCRVAKAIGCKTLYFMPPGSWRRDKQGEDLPAVSDLIATPFDWSATILRSMGAQVEWVGHPILQMSAKFPPGERSGVAVLPGSRRHEIRHNLPAIAAAIDLIGAESQPVRIVVAPTTSVEQIAQMWERLSDVTVELSNDPAPETLKRSKAAIVSSGTATLECAVCDCPMVVVYRGDKMMEIEYRIRKPKFNFFALPSILLQRKVVPELLQWHATPENIATEASSLLQDSPDRNAQLRDFDEIRKLLGPNDAITRTAKLALQLMERAE